MSWELRSHDGENLWRDRSDRGGEVILKEGYLSLKAVVLA